MIYYTFIEENKDIVGYVVNTQTGSIRKLSLKSSLHEA